MFDMKDPAVLKAAIEYISAIDVDRNKRWVEASHAGKSFDVFMVPTIQGLGKLDSRLLIEDAYIIENHRSSHPFGDLSEHITQSYLWVLGAYEIIRSLDQRARQDEKFFPELRPDFQQLKFSFERIRIPLAKFEAARKHQDTDSHIAYPGLHHEKGVSWQVAQDTWINRRELSDEMLDLLEKMKVA
ncbi:hypothetical protein [Aeromonas hydrophila]|uniref:hypothetical protein n=1 Tax=Aeromonas hydrophila TaxID=644 RepID=UPI001A8F6414|nr:hypothetical protein [Aeromonas hydrophila]UMQ35811.1 hypothetical protein MJ578_11455 [Aeromonas hydrophila]UMQ44345.1 hypothetical protein MJ573_11460 [Aeromonas hydrophila]